MKSTVIPAFIFAIILLNGLLPYNAYSQYISAQSGNFSEGSTWVGGESPPDFEDIVISAGHTVTLDRGTNFIDYIYVYNVTIETGAILNNNGFPLWIRNNQTGNPNYLNDGIHNGPGAIHAYNYFRGRISGSGVTNCDFLIENYGLEMTATTNLTINGDIKNSPGFPSNSAGIVFYINETGGNLTVNGDMISGATMRKASLNNFSGTLTVNGNITFAGVIDVVENRATLIISGNLMLGSGTGSYCWNRDQGHIEIGGNVLGGGSCYFRHGNDAHANFGGLVFPAGMGGTLQLILPTDLNIVEYSGTVAQVIKPFSLPYRNLIINNTSAEGITLSSDISVNNILTLANGNVLLADKNLTLDTVAVIAGTPSQNNMIVATGTGEVRKKFASAGSFTFPVGDNTGTAEYSPVTLSFTSGTFTDGYVGINLANSPYPGASGSYLNRYWNVTSAGITDFTCNAQFDYVPADVTGNESNLFCYRVAPSVDQYNAANTLLHQLTANGLTSFGSFTGTMPYSPDFPMAYTVTGGGSYCEGSGGREVGLSGSELTVNYTLFRNDVAQSPTIAGTGSAISFGNQLYGTYTVTGTNDFGTTLMTGNAVIIENAFVTPGITITPSGNYVCAGTDITIVATTVNGGDTPVYQWFVNGIESGDNNPDFTYVPENEDLVSLILTSSELCTNENPVESNTLNLFVNNLPEVTWPVFEPDTLCENWSPVALTGGMPEGGTYSGNGVANNTFNPAIAGPGTHDIIYTYTDGNNCSGQVAYSLFVEVCTSVNNRGSANFSLFPNPVSERFTIKTSGQIIEEIALINSLGNTIIEKKGLNKANSVSVSVNGCPAGVYFVRISCINGVFVKLITVQ
jgi:hypothetical protein